MPRPKKEETTDVVETEESKPKSMVAKKGLCVERDGKLCQYNAGAEVELTAEEAAFFKRAGAI